METGCRGHGFSDVGSGVRGDTTSGQGLSSIHLGASGEKVGSHRQAELCTELECIHHQRAIQCTLGWGQSQGGSGGGTVDFVFVPLRTLHWPLSSALVPTLPV